MLQKLQGADSEQILPAGRWVNCWSAHQTDCPAGQNQLQPVLHAHLEGWLFIGAVKYFFNRSWAKEQPGDLAYDLLLDQAKSHEKGLAEHNYDKDSRQDSIIFPAIVSASIDAVLFSDLYNCHSPSRTCGRCGLTHNSSGHCPASGAQCGKCGHPNHCQCMCHTHKTSISSSQRKHNWSKDRCWSWSHYRWVRNHQKGHKNT